MTEIDVPTIPSYTPPMATDPRQSIIEAAVRLSRTRGYHRITRDEVAASAGVGAGTVNTYFGTIAALREVVLAYAIQQGVLPIIAQGLAMGDPIARGAPEDIRIRALGSLT